MLSELPCVGSIGQLQFKQIYNVRLLWPLLETFKQIINVQNSTLLTSRYLAFPDLEYVSVRKPSNSSYKNVPDLLFYFLMFTSIQLSWLMSILKPVPVCVIHLNKCKGKSKACAFKNRFKV